MTIMILKLVTISTDTAAVYNKQNMYNIYIYIIFTGTL